MAAIHGDDIIAEGEPEKLDRLDEGLKQLVVITVLDIVGPRAAEHGQDLKRHIVYINGQRFECLEDPKHLAAIIRNRSKVGDPEAFDELEEVEGKLYQQDAGIGIYVCSGRFDIQFCVKKLSEMMTKPRKLGSPRLARLARYLVGTEKLVLRFDHQEYGHTLRIAVDSDWAGSEERYSTHTGLEFHGEQLVDSWDASNQVRALSSGEAELYGIVDGSARGIFTKHMYEEMGRTINIDVATDSTAATRMCCQTGVGKTRHIHVRWLWIQDAIRDKVVRLRKARGTDNEADMNQRPRRTDTSALLAETAAQANPVQTAPRLERDSKRRERRGSADEWKVRKRWEVFSTSDDRDTYSIGDVGPDGSARSNSSGKNC